MITLPMSAPSSALSYIHSLLDETIDIARRRERETLPSLLDKTDGAIVIFGAGRLARMCHEALTSMGRRIHAFCDNEPSCVGKVIQGTPVLSPATAIAEAGDNSLFVVAIWSGTGTDSMADRLAYLVEHGCRHITTFPAILWACEKSMLPFYSQESPADVLRNRESLLTLAELLEDESSLQVLASSLERRLLGKFTKNAISSPQYFPAEIVRPI